MTAFTKILAPVDLSERSRHTAFHAEGIARACNAELTLLHVQPHQDTDRRPGERAALLLALSDLAESLKRPRLVPLALEEGDVVTEILAYAAVHAVDLIVLGAHTRGPIERAFLASVAETVANEAPCSVLLVPEPVEEARRSPSDPSEIVCAVGFDAQSAETVARAIAMAKATKAHLSLLHVGRGRRQETMPEAYERLAELLASANGRGSADTLVTRGPVSDEIVRVASTQRASLLIVGAPTRRPFGRAVLGRTARHLLWALPCPLLLLRPVPVAESYPREAREPELALHR